MAQSVHRADRHGGFTIAETLLVVLILAIAIIPIINAFAPGLSAAHQTEKATVFVHQAQGTLYRLLSVDYARLLAHQGDPVDLALLLGSPAEAAEESFVFDGVTHTPVVAIAPAGPGVSGLLQITVSCGSVRLTTLKADL